MLPWIRECSMRAALAHSNIVHFHGILRKPLRQIVERCEAGNLQSLLVKEGEAMPWKNRLNLLLDIARYAPTSFFHLFSRLTSYCRCRAVKVLHSASPPIIYRDLRSALIFVTQEVSTDGTVEYKAKLADFKMGASPVRPLALCLSTPNLPVQPFKF